MPQLSLLLSTFLIAGLSSAAHADPTIPDYTFKISNEAGKPFVITWRDGREAALQRAVIEGSVTFPMSLTDNSCNAVAPKNCSITFPMKKIFTALVWTKHPTAGRVGTPVRNVNRFKTTVNGAETEQVSYFPAITRSVLFDDVTPTYAPEYALSSHATVSCDRMDWIPFDTSGDAQVNAWMSQSMTTNQETGISENQLTTSFTRTKLHQLDATHAEITAIGRTTKKESIDNDPKVIDSDFLLWAMKDGTGICPLSIGLDIGVATKPENVRFFTNKAPDGVPYGPFDYTADKILPEGYRDVIFALTNSSTNPVTKTDGTVTYEIFYSATEKEVD